MNSSIRQITPAMSNLYAIPPAKIFMTGAKDKEKVLEALVALTLELKTRPVTDSDLSRFVRFAVPSCLHAASGRSLTDAEAAATLAMLTMPKFQESGSSFIGNRGRTIEETFCMNVGSAGHGTGPECGAAPFVDFAFSDVRQLSAPPRSDPTNIFTRDHGVVVVAQETANGMNRTTRRNA